MGSSLKPSRPGVVRKLRAARLEIQLPGLAVPLKLSY